MRRSALVLLTALVMMSCKQEKPQANVQPATAPPTQTVAPPPIEKPLLAKSRIGSVLAPDGTVKEEKTTFTRDEKVYRSMWFTEPKPDLLARVQWFDDTGIMLSEERRPPLGMKEATFVFDFGRPKPGNYRAVGFAGDKIAVESNFVITQ